MIRQDDNPVLRPARARATGPAAQSQTLLRRRQRLDLAATKSRSAHLVSTGCLSVEAAIPGARRQVLMLLYPGDVLSPGALPPSLALTIVAGLPTTLIALAAGGGRDGPSGTASGPVAQETLTPQNGAQSAPQRQLARAGLHAIALGRLTGEERVASGLVEMALFLGRRVGNGYTFEMPMSRRDLADYLALNPDTLSRIVSRFKARRLIANPGRRHMIIADFDGLAALTPLAGALARLCPAGATAG